MISDLKHIVALVEAGGDITLGALDDRCVATATDGSQCLAMLVRRKRESLDALMRRLDIAIANAYDNQVFADEVNAAPKARAPRTRR